MPFWLEHGFKAVGFYLGVLGLFGIIAALWRLAGGVAREPHIGALLPSTPAAFWRSYNRIVHQFLLEDLFKPVGGARAPWRGILVAFLVSGLLHEYLFSWLAGRLQGYQTAFFLLHAVAVGLTVRVKPRGWQKAVWILVTALFNLAAATLFLASVHEVIPLYVNPLPDWLSWQLGR